MNFRALGFSVALHLLLFALLVFGLRQKLEEVVRLGEQTAPRSGTILGEFVPPAASVPVPKKAPAPLIAASAKKKESLSPSRPLVAESGGRGTRTSSPALARYLDSLRQRIEDHLRYPLSLRRRRITGTVVLEIGVRADGSVEKLQLAQPSGNAELDELARQASREAGPFPPAPDARAGSVLTLRIPIEFRIEEGSP